MHGAWCASYERKTPYYYKCTHSARFRARSCSRVDGTRPMYYMTTRHMRRSKEAGRRRWRLPIHGRGMRMPRLHGRQEEAWCRSACGRTDSLLCGGAPVRCRGDVHGDATIPVYVYIGAPEGASRMRKEGGVRETWREVMYM